MLGPNGGKVLTYDLDSTGQGVWPAEVPCAGDPDKGSEALGSDWQDGQCGQDSGAPGPTRADDVLTGGGCWAPELSEITAATGPRRDQASM